MTDRDPLVEALSILEVPPLVPGFAARVGARARAELCIPLRSEPPMTRLRLAVSAGLVPAMLTLAAVVETAGTASIAAKIYGKAQHASSQ